MSTNENDWRIRTWARKHATHGTFFIGMLEDGRATCSRVYGDPRKHDVEDLAPLQPFENVGLAMIACEQRIAELDQTIMDETVADLRAYAERVA